MNQLPVDFSLFQDHNDSLYGFLLAASIPLSNYFLHKNDPNKCIELFSATCYQNPFFTRMSDVSSLVMSDEKSRLIMRVTQDFLYGLNEIACQGCACEAVSHDQKEKLLVMMIQKYAQRIVTFCDLVQFEKTLPIDFQQLFIELLNDLVHGVKTNQQVYEQLSSFHNNIDAELLIQSYIFVNYISCLKGS